METEIKTTTYWRNSEPVEAVRLTEENIQNIAYTLGALFDPVGNGYGEDDDPVPNMLSGKDRAFVGDWVITNSSHDAGHVFVSHATFMSKHKTHSERIADDEEYARVYLIVAGAMNKQESATFHDRGASDEMELVTIYATKAILREL